MKNTQDDISFEMTVYVYSNLEFKIWRLPIETGRLPSLTQFPFKVSKNDLFLVKDTTDSVTISSEWLKSDNNKHLIHLK